MPLKTVTLVAAVCLTTGWLLASLLMPPVATLQSLPERRTGAAARGNDSPAPYAEQLQLRLRQAPDPPTPRRNPFVFGARDRDVVSVPGSAAGQPQRRTDIPAPIAAPPQPAGPLFSLSGIGASTTPAGPVRTAVLSDGITVQLVKVGDTVGAYKVVEVGEETVTLTNAAGSNYILRLK